MLSQSVLCLLEQRANELILGNIGSGKGRERTGERAEKGKRREMEREVTENGAGKGGKEVGRRERGG